MKQAGRMLAKWRCLLICSSRQLLMWPSRPLFGTIWSFQLQGDGVFFSLCFSPPTSRISAQAAIRSQEMLHLFDLMNCLLAWCFCFRLMAAYFYASWTLYMPLILLRWSKTVRRCFTQMSVSLIWYLIMLLLLLLLLWSTPEHCFYARGTSLARLYGMYCKTIFRITWLNEPAAVRRGPLKFP